MPTTLDQTLDAIISRAVSDIAAAVRANIADEVHKLVGGGVGPSPPAKRRGRPPGVKTKAAPASPPTPKSAAKKLPGKRGRGFRTYTDADLAHALDAIKAKPGLLPSQYRSNAKMDQRVWDNAIFALKKAGKIRVVGKARNTSYVIA